MVRDLHNCHGVSFSTIWLPELQQPDGGQAAAEEEEDDEDQSAAQAAGPVKHELDYDPDTEDALEDVPDEEILQTVRFPHPGQSAVPDTEQQDEVGSKGT